MVVFDTRQAVALRLQTLLYALKASTAKGLRPIVFAVLGLRRALCVIIHRGIRVQSSWLHSLNSSSPSFVNVSRYGRPVFSCRPDSL